MTTEITPQRMPNIVRKLRSLLARRFDSTCTSSSGMDLAWKDDLVSRLEAAQHLHARAVADANLHRHATPPGLRAGIDDVDERTLLRVVDDRGLGNEQRVRELLENYFGVGAHVGLELLAGVVDRYLDLKRGDVVLLHTDRGDFRHAT